jgi:N-acetylneuraminate synthase/N,N'-diacetyllegionaminate synthase
VTIGTSSSAGTFRIGDRELAPGRDPYVAAEIGVNFDGDLDKAKACVDAAVAAGAASAKFQTFRADEFMAGDVIYEYESGAGKVRESMRDMFARLELPAAWHKELAGYCKRKQIDFMSSAADPLSCDLLVECGVPAIKIASEDLINLPLLRHVATCGLPVILSTGMADRREIEKALDTLNTGSGLPVMLLHCVSLYPTPDSEANLRRLSALAEQYGLPVGYSDHTVGPEAAVAAVGLGALFIEKHFTLNKADAGPDHSFSADPEELADLVRRVNKAAAQAGTGAIDPGAEERAARSQFRRSIVAARAIRSGECISEDMLHLKRPGTGMHPHDIHLVIGRTANKDIAKDAQISQSDLTP